MITLLIRIPCKNISDYFCEIGLFDDGILRLPIAGRAFGSTEAFNS